MVPDLRATGPGATTATGVPDSRRPFLALAITAAGVVAGCGNNVDSDGSPRWVSLAEGFEPTLWSGEIECPGPSGPVRLSPAEDRGALRVETVLPEGTLKPTDPPEEWRAPNPLAFLFEIGANEAGTWRIPFGNVAADAVVAWPNHPQELSLDLSPHATLRFGTAFRPLFPRADGAVEDVAFRIALNGESIFEARTSSSVEEAPAWHEVELPADGGAGRLELSVHGPPGLGIFVNPGVGPSVTGTYSKRPWGSGRPNLVVFMADTLRADCLRAYGGASGLTPNVDRLAERSLCFTRTWAPSTWTLPSQASMMTGLYPFQHGAIRKDRGLSRAQETIGEHLAAHGYRTGAVTDSLYVSRTFGLDQGFEWFIELRDWNLIETLRQAREFLDRDDGRPVLLFVQTYRTHSPYRRGPTENTDEWARLMSSIEARMEQQAPELPRIAQAEAASAGFVDGLRSLYEDGVRALDRELGPWLDAVERTGLLDDGYFLFASDHGEAFGEHGEFLHGRRPWEERVAIPLLLAGPTIEPGRASSPASLLDVPNTLAELAGIPVDPAWEGRSLLRLEPDRPLYCFSLYKRGNDVAVLEGARKIIAALDSEAPGESVCVGVFDLSRDPSEREDLSGDGERWSHEWSRWAHAIEPLLHPVTDSVSVELDEDMRRRLAEVGYGGH